MLRKMKNEIEAKGMELSGKKAQYAKVAIISNGINGQKKFTCVACSAEFKEKDKLQLHLLKHYDQYKYVCGVCGRGLKRREHLDRHMQEHSGRRPHVCPQCGKAFKRKEHLNIHIAIHSGVKVLSCPVCDKKFNRKDHLQKHIETHNKHFLGQSITPMSDMELMGIKTEVEHEYEEYTTLSDLIGNSSENYQAGEMDTDGSYDGPNQSITSNESYDPTLADLAQQYLVPRESNDQSNDQSYDQSNDQSYDQSCDQSNGQSFDFSNYAVNDKPVDPARPHVCPLCGKSYKRKDHLKIHSWTHKKKEKFCTECGKAFHTSDQLLVHVNLSHVRAYEHDRRHTLVNQVNQVNVKIVNGIDTWPMSARGAGNHECTICHRKFKRKQHLKVHYNVHLKNQSQAIWCSTCKEGFYNTTLYEKHSCLTPSQESDDEEEDGEAECSPQQDARKENNPMELLEVVVNESPEELSSEAGIPSPRRVYVCKVCSKSFKRKDHFKIHQFIHTGVKTVFCPDCRKGFYRKDHLQKHMIVHARLKTKDLKVKKHIPDLFPIDQLPTSHQKEVVPEITIHAPSNTKLRVPLKIKVPYQMVMSMDNGEKRAFTVDPADQN